MSDVRLLISRRKTLHLKSQGRSPRSVSEVKMRKAYAGSIHALVFIVFASGEKCDDVEAQKVNAKGVPWEGKAMDDAEFQRFFDDPAFFGVWIAFTAALLIHAYW